MLAALYVDEDVCSTSGSTSVPFSESVDVAEKDEGRAPGDIGKIVVGVSIGAHSGPSASASYSVHLHRGRATSGSARETVLVTDSLCFVLPLCS